MTNFYAGIGARSTPKDIQKLMTKTAFYLDRKGWSLRSGGADGADSAFENGTDSKEIFIPWNKYRNKVANDSSILVHEDPRLLARAEEVAMNFHPNAKNLSAKTKALMTRNIFVLFGKNLKQNVKFLLCWTPNGAVTGGTGHALRVAEHYKIKVLNLAIEEDRQRIEAKLNGKI